MSAASVLLLSTPPSRAASVAFVCFTHSRVVYFCAPSEKLLPRRVSFLGERVLFLAFAKQSFLFLKVSFREFVFVKKEANEICSHIDTHKLFSVSVFAFSLGSAEYRQRHSHHRSTLLLLFIIAVPLIHLFSSSVF